MEIEAYCVKCKTKQPMQKKRKVTRKNGQPSYRGRCPVCNSLLWRAIVEFHREGEPDIVDIPRNDANLTTVEAEYDRAMAHEGRREQWPGLWAHVRVEIICPRCVGSIGKYLVPKGQPINLGPATCPRCDNEEES